MTDWKTFDWNAYFNLVIPFIIGAVILTIFCQIVSCERYRIEQNAKIGKISYSPGKSPKGAW